MKARKINNPRQTNLRMWEVVSLIRKDIYLNDYKPLPVLAFVETGIICLSCTK